MQAVDVAFTAMGAKVSALLLLLDGDPEVDLHALRDRAGVMAAGRWYDAAALAQLLEGVARANAGASR